MLYTPERHLKLNATPWNEARARDAVHDILERTRKGVDAKTRLWPLHPNDKHAGSPESEATFATVFETTFYYGAAGVLWAARALSEFADIESDLPSIDEVLAYHHRQTDEHPDSPFVGELGIRYVKQRLAPSGDNSSPLKALIRKAAENSCREILYGGPGALAMAPGFGGKATRAIASFAAKSLKNS